MINENVQKWLDALRSGEYKQGRKVLHSLDKDSNPSYCCLGVACDLYRKEVLGDWVPSNPGYYTYDGMQVMGFKTSPDDISRGYCSFLPEEVMQWLGLKDTQGGSRYASLSNLNDEKRFTFEQIADFIESEPKGMFK